MNLQEEGQHKERLLITGATGFIGKYILEKAIALGFDVWVAVRKESSRNHFEGLPIRLLEVDFYSVDQMAQQFAQVLPRQPIRKNFKRSMPSIPAVY